MDELAEMYGAYPLNQDPNLSEATDRVEVGMAARHPELDTEAVEALGWHWSYSAWR